MTRPDESWVLQVGRNLVDEFSGALNGKRYLILDRDTKYSGQFRTFLDERGTQVIRLPPLSPDLNAYAARFVRSIKEECLEKMIFIGQASLRHAISEFISYYHIERNHQGLQNQLIRADSGVGKNAGTIHGRPRLPGMLNYYYRAVA